jgi:hypothetical protein
MAERGFSMILHRRSPAPGVVIQLPPPPRRRWSAPRWCGLLIDLAIIGLVLLAFLFVVRGARAQRTSDGGVSYLQFRDQVGDDKARMDAIDSHLTATDRDVAAESQQLAALDGQLNLVKWMIGAGVLPLAGASAGLRMFGNKKSDG